MICKQDVDLRIPDRLDQGAQCARRAAMRKVAWSTGPADDAAKAWRELPLSTRI